MDFIGRVSGIDFQGIDKVAGEQNYIVGVLAKNASSLTKKKKKNYMAGMSHALVYSLYFF